MTSYLLRIVDKADNQRKLQSLVEKNIGKSSKEEFSFSFRDPNGAWVGQDKPKKKKKKKEETDEGMPYMDPMMM